MTGRWYKLVGHTPKPIGLDELSEQWDKDRRVALTHVGPYRVSTVFLVLDHQWTDGPPLLFETMVFGGPYEDWQDDYMARYSTWEEAERGHEQVCQLVSLKLEKNSKPSGLDSPAEPSKKSTP